MLAIVILISVHMANAGDPVEWPTSEGGNGHFYEAVHVPDGTSWSRARNAAVVAGGDLASITSQTENEFVFSLISDSKYWEADRWNYMNGPWLGGYNPSNSFEWVTGEPFTYTRWYPGEPSGSWKGVTENKLHYMYVGDAVPTWNDDRDDPVLWDDLTNPDANVRVKGYVIEYESIPIYASLEMHQAIELVFPTATNSSYQLQTSSNLVDWTNSELPYIGKGTTNHQFISIIANPSGFFRVQETSPPALIELDIPAYANLCGQWNYLQTGGYDTNWTRKVMGTTMENSYSVYLVQELDQDGNPDDQEFFRADLSDGLYEVGGLNDYGEASEDQKYWAPLAPALMQSFIPGAEYTNSYTRTSSSGAVAGPFDMITKTEADTISVPFGSDIDCYKVTRTILFEGETMIWQNWYAKHIGLVKRIQEDGTVWELTFYAP
jgi:hypothetical protein